MPVINGVPESSVLAKIVFVLSFLVSLYHALATMCVRTPAFDALGFFALIKAIWHPTKYTPTKFETD